jgi:hypothetical protein
MGLMIGRTLSVGVFLASYRAGYGHFCLFIPSARDPLS